jgi:hypothetical protein
VNGGGVAVLGADEDAAPPTMAAVTTELTSAAGSRLVKRELKDMG